MKNVKNVENKKKDEKGRHTDRNGLIARLSEYRPSVVAWKVSSFCEKSLIRVCRGLHDENVICSRCASWAVIQLKSSCSIGRERVMLLRPRRSPLDRNFWMCLFINVQAARPVYFGSLFWPLSALFRRRFLSWPCQETLSPVACADRH